MKILIEIPDAHFPLMRAMAQHHKQTLEGWIAEHLASDLECDLEGATSDVRENSKP